MEFVLPALIIGAAIIAAVFIATRLPGRRRTDDAPMALLQNQINATVQQITQQNEALRKSLNEAIQALSGQMSKSLTDSNKAVGDRLDNTAKVIGDVRQQLGQLKESSERIIELGKDISSLEDILQPPKLRGGLGELFLGDLLAQILPAEHYALQHPFKGGEIVDAVIKLRSGMVPIDAKFPIEDFRRIIGAENDDERKTAKKAFIRTVKGHIDDIAKKYIRMDENPFDFALMYIPAENVYYETIIKDDESDDEMAIFNYAMKKRVIPVSPNTFYAYLQTILLGLKGLSVEERSREILENLARLQRDFDSFANDFRVLGQHLDNSSKKYAEAQKRFEKVEIKIEQIDGLAKGIGKNVENGTQGKPTTESAPR
jgi:DNA recombination protein RmuC